MPANYAFLLDTKWITNICKHNLMSKLSPFAIKKRYFTRNWLYFSSNSLSNLPYLIEATWNVKFGAKRYMCPLSKSWSWSWNSWMKAEMKSQDIIDIFKFAKRNTEGLPLPLVDEIVLTYLRYLSTVDATWYKCKVEHSIPNPMQKLPASLTHNKKM